MRCVLYLRMSRDFQENSPTDQKAALVEYAKKKGYEIVGEYLDEGISGDATEKRHAFQKMIKDCKSKRFDAVLCWDQDRFGRFDPLEAGFWIKPMRDAGVVLETIAQGLVNWNDFAGRIVWSVNQEAKHAYLRDLARNSLRGNIARAKEGRHGGPVPFGYVNNGGKLELSDPAATAAIRRIFELRKLRLGYRVIASQMKKEGHPTPGEKPWSIDSVRAILNRETYTGTFVYGTLHSGKYATMTDGSVSPSNTSVHSQNASPIKVPDNHPAIIDLTTWEVVRSMVDDPPKPHGRNGSDGAPLSGILTCGRCGKLMYSQTFTGAKKKRSPIYICSEYLRGHGCGFCQIRQSVIHDIVATKIREEILGRSIERLTARIIASIDSRQSKGSATKLKGRIRSIEDKIATATKRLSIVDDSLFDSLHSQILAMQQERKELAAMVPATDSAPNPGAKDVARWLWELASIFEKEASVARSTLKAVFHCIRADFTEGHVTGRGKSFVYSDCHLLIREFIKPCGTPTIHTAFMTYKK